MLRNCTQCLFGVLAALRKIISLLNFLVTSVYFAEDANKFLAANWRAFSSDQYFDRDGMFISFIWSIPCIINAMIILVWSHFDFDFKTFVLYTALDLLVEKKLGMRRPCQVKKDWAYRDASLLLLISSSALKSVTVAIFYCLGSNCFHICAMFALLTIFSFHRLQLILLRCARTFCYADFTICT